MKRISVFALLAVLAINAPAVGNHYATLNANVYSGDPGLVRGFLGDYDIEVTGATDNPANATNLDLTLFTGPPNKFHEVFCIEKETLDTPVSFEVFDLADLVGVAAATSITKIVAAAGHSDFTDANSGFAALTTFSFNSLGTDGVDGARGNVDNTVGAVQYAIWDVLNIGTDTASDTDIKDAGEWLLAHAATTNATFTGTLLGLTVKDAQDYGILYTGEFQIDVPEPAMVANLVGLGLFGLGYARFRNRRRKSA